MAEDNKLCNCDIDIDFYTLSHWLKTFRSYVNIAEGMFKNNKYDETISIGFDAISVYKAILEFIKQNKLLNKVELTIVENRFSDNSKLSNKDFECLELIKTLNRVLGSSYRMKAEEYYKKEDYITSLRLSNNAVLYNPNDIFTNYTLANTLSKLGAKKEAADSYEKVVALDKNYHYGRRLLGDLYESEEIADYDKAIFNYEKYFEHYKNDAHTYGEYSRNCYKLGYHDLSDWASKKSVELNSKEFYIFEFMFLNALRSEKYNQKEVKELTEQYIDKYIKTTNTQKNIYSFEGRKTKKDKLRIGYLSSDMYSHVVSKFLVPVIEEHSKNKNIELFLFSSCKKQDSVTKKYKDCTKNFFDCSAMNYKEIADLIYEHKIDILVDLNGLTGNSKLITFAYKPAPIQATWLGYPNTSGLDTIDYILTDKDTIMPNEADLYTEKPAYIEHGYEIFRVDKNTIPEITPSPYHKNKYITLGVFNATSKVTNKMLNIWAEIMKREKNTKILFQYINHYTPGKQNKIIAEFEKHGISPKRIIFYQKGQTESLFKCMALADIALDTNPYSGCGTTIDSLLTGLPIICYKGDCATSRPTSRILKSVNHRELIADNYDDYIKNAINLIKHPALIDNYRKSLQGELLNSRLTDYKGFTKSLEQTYEKMWENYLSNS